MTVTDRGFESFLQDRENIAHIAGSKFIFMVRVKNKNDDMTHII